MELTTLSKIKYNNKYYQIFCNEKGNRYFYLIEDDKYKEVDLKTNIELAKIFNNSFDGKLYIKEKTIAGAATICSIGLGIITLYGINGICKLYKDYVYKNISFATSVEGVTYNDIVPYIDSEEDLDSILENNKKIDEQYYSYIEGYVKTFKDQEDLTIFYYNLEDMEIKEVDRKQMNKYSGENFAGYYDIVNNEVIISTDVRLNSYKEVLYHEFRHATKYTCIDVDGKLYCNVFNNNDYGTAFLEGMNAKYTDFVDITSTSYPVQQVYINMFIDIFGEEKLKEIEMYGNADTLINELSKINGTEVDAKRLLMLMDDELNATVNNVTVSTDTLLEIKRIISSYFLANEKHKLLNSNDDNYKLKYINYINNCDKFKRHFSEYATTGDMVYKNSNYNGSIENEEINEWFDGMEQLYLKEFLDRYYIDEEEILDLNTSIYVGESYDYIDSSNLNIQCYVNDYDTYDLYMKKAYLLYGEKDEILNYISEERYYEMIEDLNQKSR